MLYFVDQREANCICRPELCPVYTAMDCFIRVLLSGRFHIIHLLCCARWSLSNSFRLFSASLSYFAVAICVSLPPRLSHGHRLRVAAVSKPQPNGAGANRPSGGLQDAPTCKGLTVHFVVRSRHKTRCGCHQRQRATGLPDFSIQMIDDAALGFWPLAVIV
jgi:hypothetical protein